MELIAPSSACIRIKFKDQEKSQNGSAISAVVL